MQLRGFFTTDSCYRGCREKSFSFFSPNWLFQMINTPSLQCILLIDSCIMHESSGGLLRSSPCSTSSHLSFYMPLQHAQIKNWNITQKQPTLPQRLQASTLPISLSYCNCWSHITHIKHNNARRHTPTTTVFQHHCPLDDLKTASYLQPSQHYVNWHPVATVCSFVIVKSEGNVFVLHTYEYRTNAIPKSDNK